MDWNLKATSGDFTEFVQETVSTADTDIINGNESNSYKLVNSIGDFRVDLKLGQVGNSGELPSNKWKEPRVLKMESSSSSSKKFRPTNIGTHPVVCLVDECNTDLSNCRDYHRRHKVCELHSKTAEVMINGLKQRFCQQCSRFHSLEEFDNGKRSCRARLDRHNRRRRKPQPDPLSHSRSYFSNYQGSQMLPFSGLQVYPSTSVVKTTWPESRYLNLKQPPAKQNLLLGSSSSNYREGKQQCSFLQGKNQTPAKASICQPVLGGVAPFSEGNGGCRSMLCDRLTTQVRDSDCALSLLSSPLLHTSGIGLSNMVQPQSFPLVQSLGPSLQDHIIEPMGSVIANGRETTVHGSGMFHMGSGGSSASEPPENLGFNWQ
ncbi:squamosa promoter-binding-like protein 13A [Gossypium hirsutum]|uniref:SQUAMOSA promoter binding-like transcription factor n=1 Tax=Gossypium hirsutum TaxID=3635 RepID=A0A088DL58_GOSHI|nr:squamosa promoter-binding-like protein 13A [Gossypium hirsutum]AIL95863.1 SQUAMOSA promoter binding-like transcription factor [Gossypium hirsutum]